MARRWNPEEEARYRAELVELYVRQNMTIREVGAVLDLADQTVFRRLKRLGISTCPERKPNYLRKRKDVRLPSEYSKELAEFLGIMLGDGHISKYQTIVTLGTKELDYVQYVAELMSRLFGVPATIIVEKNGYHDVYIGSIDLTRWLRGHGLVSNKVRDQVDVPGWITNDPEWMQAFIRGFFDTDGSIYRLRFGCQISLTNHSLPLLRSLRVMLSKLGYKPSEVSAYRVYLTRRGDVKRFFEEVRPANTKHTRRFEVISKT